ncbi:winged helix-turn-helix domain-containing protein [Stackebrandtia nassauensis]|uniref:Putative transcriptional regulator n=1 Tax=Stackebrandtia nassauensis (strain DSM 44728 / CIP 108903 / NRRL B-16338 / NBRC 102104 / LLR-40K-21) TaxID=446470 RepID=D3PYA9_STANL|nr:helix-turn-helix domain-containing protein [Stackebrandtia nassauensis]ADD41476.1 putative transcriptional regulator [Stackebrandtia nassauensis DSM 44728]
MTEDSSTPSAEHPENWPQRQLRDATSLRALAHPLRLRLLELLGVHGPATATELAERVGHSPANCSWHLRQLAAGGFIEEAEGGTGRQRIWRFVPSGSSYGYSDDAPEVAEAAATASAIQLEHEVDELRTWRATRHTDSDRWRDVAFTTQSILWLTADELEELSEQVAELYLRQVRRHFEPETRPTGSRPVRLIAWGIPAKNLETEE